MRKTIRIGVLILFTYFASSASLQAQTKFLATSSCGIATVHQTAAISDAGEHSISLDQRECRFEKPLELAGVSFSSYVATGVDDVQFEMSGDRGYAVGQAGNGDKYFLRYEGRAMMKGGVPLHLAGRWRFTGGTGKLRGLHGEGTYSAEPTSSGGMIFTLKGRYKLSIV
jgi:hypothetical protein